MGWSARRTAELAQRQRDRTEELEARARLALNRHGPIEAASNLLCGVVGADCPPGQSKHQMVYSRQTGTDVCHFNYRHPDGGLFSCIRPTLADCQAARNAWLVERAEAAQRERARAETEDAASMVDADLFRESNGRYFDR